MNTTLLNVIMASVLCSAVWAQDREPSGKNAQPVEVGYVQWGRDLDAALARAKKERKPVLVLFQEVPGCAGCKKFGRDVLSHPLIVEAIEAEFVPMLVYNNRKGQDAKLLSRFREPAWNYQVMRFLDASGKDILPRKDRIWTVGGVARRLSEALEKAGRKTPAYLHGLSLEYDNPNLQEAVFAMYCFWTGELRLGAIEGVVKTEAGFFDRREVTRVWFDSSLITLDDLVRKASKLECAGKVYVASNQQVERLGGTPGIGVPVGPFDVKNYRKASDSDQKKQIQRSSFLALGLTEYQLTKVNAFARSNKQKALGYLSPRQIERLE